MSIRQTERRPSQPLTGGPEPLEPGQRQHLAGALADLVPNWSVELQYDVRGEVQQSSSCPTIRTTISAPRSSYMPTNRPFISKNYAETTTASSVRIGGGLTFCVRFGSD